MVADTKRRPDAVDLADTHTEVKTLSQFHLHGGTRCLWSLADTVLQERFVRLHAVGFDDHAVHLAGQPNLAFDSPAGAGRPSTD